MTEDHRKYHVQPNNVLKTPSELLALVRWANKWGNDPLLVQGPGGNLSYKNGDLVTIKASGSRMADATADQGWTSISALRCIKGLPIPRETMPRPADELAYAKAISDAKALENAPMPSIEAGLHAVLPARFIVHLHSVAAQLIAAMPVGFAMADRTLAAARDTGFSVVLVPPAIPGTHLTWAVAGRSQHAGQGLMMLLKGHGVVWAADDPVMLEGAIDQFEQQARLIFGIPETGPKTLPHDERLRMDLSIFDRASWDWHPFFPDFAVFFPTRTGRHRLDTGFVDLGPLTTDGNNRNLIEIAFAQAVLGNLFARFGVVNPLPRIIAEATVALELENRRLKTAKGLSK